MSDHDEPEHQHRHLSYADAVLGYRADKDRFFKDSTGSPIPAEDRSSFAGLTYFPVDETMVIDDLALEPYTGDAPVRFEIPTSDGRLRPAERAGVFRFGVDGRELTITAYRLAGGTDGALFVPFLDATSGAETYGAGRYLDIEAQDDGTYSLDFNLAYHPSCAYDPRFSCPITPPENRLPVRIEAGERLPPATA
ncbi:MAG: DUF1684 domain-containing protein [Candidatus Limnocylindrales bacterium]